MDDLIPADNVKGLDNAALKKLIVPDHMSGEMWEKSFSRITGEKLVLWTEAQLEKYAGADGLNIYNLLHANTGPGTSCRRRRVVLLWGLVAHVSMSYCAVL